MADQESTDVSTEVEDDGVSLEDMNVSFEDFEDEDEKLEQELETETEDTEPEESEEESEDTDSEETEESEEETEETEPVLSDQEKQKQANREAAEKRIADKREREAKIKEEQDKYIASDEDPIAKAVRELQVQQYNNTVKSNENTLTNDYNRALQDNEILRSDNPAIQKRVDRAIKAFQAESTTFDKDGRPSDVRGSLYDYLTTEAESIQELSGLGATKQAEDKSKQKSKTIQTPTRVPRQPKTDAMLDAFDEEAKAP